MKKVLVFALIAVFVLSLSSCGKKKEKTNTEKIAASKGWVLKSATIDPVVYVQDQATHNFMDYLYNYEKDDIIVFNTNNSFIIKPGKLTPSEYEDGYVEEKASTWEFTNNETKVKMQIPFFYEEVDWEGGEVARTFNPQFEEPEISSLSETEMVLIYKSEIAFAKGTTYTLTLTYEAVK